MGRPALSPDDSKERAKIAAALVLTGPVHPDALPGRGIRFELAVPVLRRLLRRPRPGQGCLGRPSQGVRPVRLEARGRPRAGLARDLSTGPRCDWDEMEREPHALAPRMAPRSDRAAPQTPATDRRPARPGRDRIRRGTLDGSSSSAGWSRSSPTSPTSPGPSHSAKDGRPCHVLLASVDEGIDGPRIDEITLPANSVAILGPIVEDTAQALFRSSVEVLSI